MGEVSDEYRRLEAAKGLDFLLIIPLQLVSRTGPQFVIIPHDCNV